MSPVGYVARRHFHPSQEEQFVVLEGRFGYSIGDRTGVAEAGETLVCPIGISHTQWNAGDSIARIYYEHRPALRSAEVFFETYFGLSRDGKLTPSGDLPLLQGVVLLQEVGDFIRPSNPPPLLQRFLFPPLAAFGRAAGHRARYQRYALPTE